MLAPSEDLRYWRMTAAFADEANVALAYLLFVA